MKRALGALRDVSLDHAAAGDHGLRTGAGDEHLHARRIGDTVRHLHVGFEHGRNAWFHVLRHRGRTHQLVAKLRVDGLPGVPAAADHLDVPFTRAPGGLTGRGGTLNDSRHGKQLRKLFFDFNYPAVIRFLICFSKSYRVQEIPKIDN